MDEQLQDIMEIEQVLGINYFSFDGKVLFRYYKQNEPQGIDDWDLSLLAAALNKTLEAEFVFENTMLYIIKGRKGFLLAVMGRSAPVALVRLSCNILLATLDSESQKPKGLVRLLKK